MSKHLLSLFVLIGFAFLALFPATPKSTKVLSKPTALKIHRTHLLKTLVYTSKVASP